LDSSPLCIYCNLSAEIFEEWTFGGSNPETGINGTTVSTWTTAAPNSVPSAGVLRYATPNNGSGALPSTIDVTSTDQLILTIDLADFYIGTNGTSNDQVVFQFIEDGAANIELELNVFTDGSFSIDMEGFGSTLDPVVVPGLNPQNPAGNGATLIVATWDFASGSMSFEVSGAGTQTASLTGLSDPTLTQITGFRPRGGAMANGTFLDLDTVTIEVNTGTPPPTTLILEEGFEAGTQPFAGSGNTPVAVAVPDARAGSYVMKSQLTPDSTDPERTEVTLNQSQWNFDVDAEYWVGISIKLDNDFNDGRTFNDQGMLAQWHYRDFDYSDGYKPQPLMIRFNGDNVIVEHEFIDGSGTEQKTTFATLPPAYGQWVDWVVRVKFSDTAGIFQVWRNGTLVVDQVGIDNHLTERPDGAYMKFGLYSAQYDPVTYSTWGNPMDPGATRTAYHDELRIADSTGGYDVVKPGGVGTEDPLKVTGISYDAGIMTLSFSARSVDTPADFVLQSSSTLDGFTDDVTADPITGVGGNFQVTVPFNGPRRFYRVGRVGP
jgi:hypothetical protein